MNIRNSRLYLIILLLLSLVVLAACQQRRPRIILESPSPDLAERTAVPAEIVVVTTIFPLYDVAKSIGGDVVTVHNLLPPGGSPHTFDPGPDQVRAIEESQLVFKIGLGLDDWLDRVIRGSSSDSRVIVTVSDNIETIPMSGDEHRTCSSGHVGCSQSGVDPHIWVDPVRMKQVAANIRDAYIKAMPDYEEEFQKNCDIYEKRLDELDLKYKNTLQQFQKKDYVSYHSFMNYLGVRYGIRQVAVVSESAGKEPDPQEIMRIVEKMRAEGVRVIFAEPQFSPKSSEMIANETGAKVYVVDPMGSEHDPARNTYYRNMETNLKTMEQAFREQYSKNE
jgi:zinc transport system substrate-binding protein